MEVNIEKDESKTTKMQLGAESRYDKHKIWL